MIITENRKRNEAIELFPSLESFTEEIKISYNNLNFENINIQNKILDVYNKIINDEGLIQRNRLCRWFPSKFNFKYKNINQLEFWLERGYTDIESKLKVSEIQSIRSKKCIDHSNKGKFKENLRKKGYTEEEITECCLTPDNVKFWQNKGLSEKKSIKKVFNNQGYAAKFVDCEKRLIPNKVDYWKNLEYSDEESKQKVKERQTTFSKEICIEKYGEEKGIQRWKERQIKWLINYKKSNYSQVSQKLFQEIYLRLPKNLDIYFATLNKNKEIEINTNKNYEYRLELNESYILPDFFIKNKNKILEFDGTYFHRNTPENAKRENIRNENIIKSGYKVYHVSEFEYKQDKELVIQKCIDFINIG